MYKKAKKIVKTAAKKRYKTKTGGMRTKQLVKDVMYLKSVLNPEKKRFTNNSLADGGSLRVGQTNGLVDGVYTMTAHPIIPQGITSGTRNGASVKLHSSIWHLKLNGQTNQINAIRGIIEIWSITDQTYATNVDFLQAKYDLNPFIGAPGVRDTNSQYDPDFYTMGKCLARRRFTVRNDDVNGQNNSVDMMIPIKYNKGQGHHLRYAADSTTLTSGQLVMIIRCNRGNCSASTVSTMTGILETAVLTGIDLQYNVIHYYYDN